MITRLFEMVQNILRESWLKRSHGCKLNTLVGKHCYYLLPLFELFITSSSSFLHVVHVHMNGSARPRISLEFRFHGAEQSYDHQDYHRR